MRRPMPAPPNPVLGHGCRVRPPAGACAPSARARPPRERCCTVPLPIHFAPHCFIPLGSNFPLPMSLYSMASCNAPASGSAGTGQRGCDQAAVMALRAWLKLSLRCLLPCLCGRFGHATERRPRGWDAHRCCTASARTPTRWPARQRPGTEAQRWLALDWHVALGCPPPPPPGLAGPGTRPRPLSTKASPSSNKYRRGGEQRRRRHRRCVAVCGSSLWRAAAATGGRTAPLS